jgi:WD40 repeat protein
MERPGGALRRMRQRERCRHGKKGGTQVITAELLERFQPAKEVQTLAADVQLRSARYSPCGKARVGGSFDARVRRWNASDDAPAELPAIEGHRGWIDGLAFRAQDELLFTGDSWGQLQAMRGYAAEQPELAWRHETAHDGWIRDLAVSPDGRLVASCGSDRVCRVWGADDGQKLHELAAYGRDLFRLAWAPDGTLLTGDDRGMVKQWRLDGSLVRAFDASKLYVLSRLQDVGGVQTLAIDRAGKRLAVGGVTPRNGDTVVGAPTLLLFDLATGEQTDQWKLGSDNDCFVADVHFHEAGFLALVTYGTPGQGQLIYVSPGEPTPLFTRKLTNPQSLSWHPAGQRLAVVTTNAGSNGNGRPVDKSGNYKTNQSPIQVFRIPG